MIDILIPLSAVPPKVDRRIGSAEASEILGIHPTLLPKWEKAGKVDSVRTSGGHRRFLESEIRKLASKFRSEIQEEEAQAAIAPPLPAPIVQTEFFDLEEVIHRHARIVQRIQVLIETRLQTFNPQQLTARDLIFWLEKSITIERLCIGLAAEYNAHRFTGDLSTLSDDQLNQLAAGFPFAPVPTTAVLEHNGNPPTENNPT